MGSDKKKRPAKVFWPVTCPRVLGGIRTLDNQNHNLALYH
jgi:hypothetical protein